MAQRWKLIILSSIIVILSVLVVRHTLSVYYGFKGLSLPSAMSRQDNSITVHRWMTVVEVAERYGLTSQEVFEILQITPQFGDEKLTLRELKVKYNKTPEEMQSNVQRILDKARKPGQSS